MIKDAKIKTDIATNWAVVRKLSSNMGRVTITGWIQQNQPDEYYNLPFVLAISVLDQVLSELIEQGQFNCSNSRMLGKKMTDSRSHLPWQDYAIIEQAKNERNNLAHEGKLLLKMDCLKYINAIEHELKSWGII